MSELIAGRPPRRTADDAVGDLFASDGERLLRLAVLLVDDRDLAEDVVQDAFLGLHRRWRFIRSEDPSAYLRTAVVNRARSVLRRRRTARAYVPEAPADHPSAEQSAVEADEHRAVARAVAGLPRRQREVVVLRYWMDLSEAEIADTLGIARGSVKGYASRALDALGTVMEERA